MISIYEGRIGGGKTYTAVETIAGLVAKGLTVATNIELMPEGFAELVRSRYGVEIQDGQLIDLRGVEIAEFHKVTPAGQPGEPVTCVLDEAHLDFNARDWNKTSRELLAFLTQSRKQHTDIVFISQSAENIDKQFRRLVGSIHRFRDLKTFRVPGLGVTWSTMIQVISFGLCSGDQLLRCVYDYDGKTMLAREWVTKDPRVFAAYNTFALLSNFERSGTRGKVTMQKSNSTVRGFSALRILMIVALVGVCVVLFMIRQGKEAGEKREAAVAATSEPPASKPEPQATGPIFAQSVMQPPTPAEKQEKAVARYEVFRERFRGNLGGELFTDAGEYRSGEMSPRGLVVSVKGRTAMIDLPDGRQGWVVADEQPLPDAPKPAETLQPEPVAAPDLPTVKMAPVEYARAGIPTPENDAKIWAARSGVHLHEAEAEPLKTAKTGTVPTRAQLLRAMRGTGPAIRSDLPLATAMPSL